MPADRSAERLTGRAAQEDSATGKLLLRIICSIAVGGMANNNKNNNNINIKGAGSQLRIFGVGRQKKKMPYSSSAATSHRHSSKYKPLDCGLRGGKKKKKAKR